MRTIFTIVLCILLFFAVDLLIGTEILQYLNEFKIESQIVDNELHIYTEKHKETELIQHINYVLTLVEPYFTGFNVIFHTGEEEIYIPANILVKYYSVQIMDRQDIIDLEAIRVK